MVRAGSVRVFSADELTSFAREFVHAVTPREAARVIALSGELGAGKTTFAQGVAHALGVAETVSSPTFVIEKVYALAGQSFQRLIHIDAYRLSGAQDLRALGWEEIILDLGNLILLEWPERVPELIPADAIRIRFDIRETGRIITIDGSQEGN